MGNCQNFNPQQNDPIKSTRNNDDTLNSLTIKAFTWQRDSHGLFDYESKCITKSIIKVEFSGLVVRQKEEVKMIEENSENLLMDENKPLISVLYNDGLFFIDRIFSSHSNNQSEIDGLGDTCPWIVIKSLKNENGIKGHRLSAGDYIKLGRVRFRIKDMWVQISIQNNLFINQNSHIMTSEQKNNEKDSQQFKFNVNHDIMKLEKEDFNNQQSQQDLLTENDQNNQSQSNIVTCRICLGEGGEYDNPLICPCKCSGTMKFIHIKCLQKWLTNKLHPKQTINSISFVWKTFECELCKVAFPNSIEVDGKKYDTVDIPRPEPPYVTLEILSRDRNLCKGIHVITLAHKNMIKLGRGHDSDIRITDISVSRCHAMIRYDKGQFYMEDNNSKFGTLVLMKDKTKLQQTNNNIALQIGRSVISFTLKRQWKILSVCFGGNPIQTQKINKKPSVQIRIDPEDDEDDIINNQRQMASENNDNQQDIDIQDQLELDELENEEQQLLQNQQEDNNDNDDQPEVIIVNPNDAIINMVESQNLIQNNQQVNQSINEPQQQQLMLQQTGMWQSHLN